MECLELKNEDDVFDFFGWFWDYDAITVKYKLLEEIAVGLTSEDEKKYFDLFRSSMLGKFMDSLSIAEIDAIYSYIKGLGSNYKEVNSYLRFYKVDGNSTDVPRVIALLDSAMKKFILEKPVVLYRGVVPHESDDILSGVTDYSELIGKTYTDYGFMSCSPLLEESYAVHDDYSIVWRIEAPCDTPGMYIAPFKGTKDHNYEFLLARGTTLEITGVSTIMVNAQEKTMLSAKVVTLEKEYSAFNSL